MTEFEQNFNEVQKAAERAAEWAFAVWIAGLVLAVIAAFWIYRDAEVRGKLGIAAALMVLVSATLDFRVTLIALCAWVLVRPDRKTRLPRSAIRELPTELSSDIVAGPSASEYLGDLES